MATGTLEERVQKLETLGRRKDAYRFATYIRPLHTF
jgi:hypothetical protein